MRQIILLLLTLSALAFQAHALPVPSMFGFVNDPQHLFSSHEKLSLIDEVSDINKRTGAQVAVLVLPSLEGENLETFATQTFNTWRLGNAQRNDGVLILVAWQDRRVRVEVGRGLESVITDALASQVIKEQMLPYFREGDLLSGLNHGLAGVDALLSGQPLPSPASASWAWVRGKLVNFSYWQGLPFLAVGLFLLVLKRKKRTVRVLFFGSLLLTPALAITSEFISWVMPFVWLSLSVPFISIFSGLFFLWLYPQRLLAVGGSTLRDDSATWNSTSTSHLHHHSGGDSGSHSSDNSSSGDGGSSDGGGSSDSW